jgi:aryl-alcohol dehydrogenase-like predicted oxidoreductase
MQSLNNLVVQGKVLYLGVSDTPAWVVSKANQYARDHGLRQFCVYQGRWNAASRDFEREIIPMCRDEGVSITPNLTWPGPDHTDLKGQLGLAPWGALGAGAFKTEEQRKSQEGRKVQATEQQLKISGVLEKIANRKNTAITSVALVSQEQPYPVFSHTTETSRAGYRV